MKRQKNKTTESRPISVPKLRFPEFRGESGWETRTLGSFASICSEKVGDNECVPMSITSGVGLVSQMEKFGRVIAGDSYKNYLLLKKNDFAYNKSATKQYPEGFIALYSDDALAAVPNSIFTSFRVNGDTPLPQYLNYLFLGNLHGRWLRKFVEVGSRAHGSLSVDDDDLLALPVPLPRGQSSRAEQQKIAECLNTLDELIGAESQKLDALKTCKKGLMQQLFPRERETLPRLRFPEFRQTSEWEQRAFYGLLESVLDFRGRTPGKLGMQWGGGEIVSLSANNVKNGYIDFRAECNLASDELHEKWMGKVALEKGDIVFTMEAPLLGNALLIPDSARYILSQRVVAFKTKRFVSNQFLVQLIWGDAFQDAVERLATGSTAKGINQKSLQRVLVRLPSISEQQRIASCLSALDDLIAARGDKLSALKAHKEGLMQQLFPKPEAA